MTPPTWRELMRELPGLALAVVLALGVSVVLVLACAEVGVTYGRGEDGAVNEHSARVAVIQGEATAHVERCAACHQDVPDDPFWLCPAVDRILAGVAVANAGARRWDFD